MTAASDLAPEQLLRAAGLRVTRPRVAVIQALADAPHSGADAVLVAVRDDVPSGVRRISTQAVYDVLNVLAERGVVRRIQPAGSVARYELGAADDHHHLVCRRCGLVVDVGHALGPAPCLTSGPDHGFDVDDVEVTFWGLCPRCRTADPDPTG